MKRFGLFWAAMCLAAALATACGGSSNSSESQSGTATATASGSEATSAPAPASASAATITIASMNYGEPVTVPPGAQIAIKNNDSVEHSVTSDTAGKFTVDVDGNEQGTLTAPSEPGEYAFHCKYHPSMHGTLIVK
jgi:plastocyanin